MKNSLRGRLAAAGAAAALLLMTNTAVALPAAAGGHGAPNIPPCPDPPIVDRGNGPALPNSDNPCPNPPSTIMCHLVPDDGPELDRGAVGTSAVVECSDEVSSISIIVDLYRRTSSGFTRIARDHKTVYNMDVAGVTASTACEPGTHTYFGTAQATVNKPPSQTFPKQTTRDRTYTC
jgi:hypothetical protein